MPGRNQGERLVVDPNDHRILFLGTRSGNGLWKSTDYAQSWKRVTSFPAVGSYAPDPSDPSGYSSDPIGVVWTAFDKSTGKPGRATQTIYVGVADLGTSIYRSRDGGLSWDALPGQPTSPASGGVRPSAQRPFSRPARTPGASSDLGVVILSWREVADPS